MNHLAEAEYRFACLVWDTEPLPSGQLVKLSAAELGWKKSTTYTVLKKLCVKGLVRNENARVTVLAADNGVVAEGVSCAPQSVTVQQAVNMTRHKTGMSALAAYFGDDVQVVDVGIRTLVPCP